MRIRLAVAIAVLALGGCEQSNTLGRDWHKIEPPAAAPEFSLQQLDGGTVSLSGLRGKIVIMEFWATWCGPCRYSTPSLEVIYKRYRDRGVAVLLINEGEPAETVQKWAQRRFTAPILLDHEGEVAGRYGLDGIPALFVVNQNGQLVYRHDGYSGGLERNLELILEELLPQQAPTHV